MNRPHRLDKPVLVVENNDATREAVCLILECDGYRVSAACNGRMALDRLRGGERPALILLDLMMPVMDGWQFREELQRDQSLADIPVVLCSAAGDVRHKAASLHAVDYLNKPVEVRSCLRWSGATVEIRFMANPVSRGTASWTSHRKRRQGPGW